MAIKIKIELGKINKERITTRTYTNGEGTEVTVKEYATVLIPLKEEKILKETDTYILKKTHFLAEDVSKEEKDNGYKGQILGDGIQFTSKDTQVSSNTDMEDGNIPF